MPLQPLPTVLVFVFTLAIAPASAGVPAAVTLVVEADVTSYAGAGPASLAALPGVASCAVEVAPGSTMAHVLDAAVASACIASWSCDDFGFDCFVSEVDGLSAVGASCLAWPAACQWWEIFVDDGTVPAATGVHGHTVRDGEVLRALFHTTCTPTLCP